MKLTGEEYLDSFEPFDVEHIKKAPAKLEFDEHGWLKSISVTHRGAIFFVSTDGGWFVDSVEGKNNA